MTADTATVLPPFDVTRSAIGQIEEGGGAVRIDVEPGGCCGIAYTFERVAAGEWADGDDVYGCPGAWLVVSGEVGPVLAGAVLDYSDQLKPPRFRVLRNPNTPDVCPCKRSFGAPWPGRGDPDCRSYLPMPWDDTYEPPIAWRRQTGRLP